MIVPMLMAMALEAQDVTDADACARLTRGATEETRYLPRMVDAVTRFDAVAADCAARTYTMTKTVMREMRDANPGWQARTQAELNEIVCGGNLRPIAALGWQFIEKLRFAGGEEVTLIVSCD